jgi:hypothetical protein
LNSTFGIALFSAIFLTLVPWVYKTYLLSYQESRTNTQNTMELLSEIDHRLYYVAKIKENFPQYQRNDLILAFHGENEGLIRKYYNFKSTSPKLASQSLLGLTIRFARLNQCIDSLVFTELRTEIDRFKDSFLAQMGNFKGRDIPPKVVGDAELSLQKIISVWSKLQNEC